MWAYNNSSSLAHHGIKGQRWGVRRFQNADGSLTAAGKKRINKQYAKEAKAGDKKLQEQYDAMYLKAYNQAADKMNSGGIQKFNADQEKKYGKEYYKRVGYEADYSKFFEKEVNSIMSKSLLDLYDSDKHYQAAARLIKQYDMTKWSDLAKSNQEGIDNIRRLAGQ